MKKYLGSTALVSCVIASPVWADPTFMVGLTMSFGGSQGTNVGISGRVLSDNKRDSAVGMAGVTYYPQTGTWGIDAGLGYNFDNTTVGVTYDFMNQNVAISGGWADLADLDDIADSDGVAPGSTD